MPIDAYVEVGTKRAFAGAIDWPGWSRSGRTADAAIEALVAYGARYADVLRPARVRFSAPKSPDALAIVERLTGDATTDFGAPSVAPAADGRAIDRRWLTRQLRILEACWQAFDRAVDGAEGVALRAGPRGGGRALGAIAGHVVGAEAGYARMIDATPPPVDGPEAAAARDEVRAVVRDALDRAVTEGIPAEGPRGGKRWSAPYFVRRAAWHVLDHAWEIDDRSTPL